MDKVNKALHYYNIIIINHRFKNENACILNNCKDEFGSAHLLVQILSDKRVHQVYVRYNAQGSVPGTSGGQSQRKRNQNREKWQAYRELLGRGRGRGEIDGEGHGTAQSWAEVPEATVVAAEHLGAANLRRLFVHLDQES